MLELTPRFNFKDIEEKWCAYWEEHPVFHAEPQAQKKPYSIVIPPPNVTGILHMGHALNNTLQDIIVRYKRMQGFETCWMPGTDHAGIATQNVVEKELAKEGKTRHDVGREELLRRLWDWKSRYGDTIIQQLKRLGCSCDWQRTRFTMDDEYSRAVKKVFVHLYQKGIIYRGQYIINWCPRCQTALSDEEAEHKDQLGKLYYIRYPFQESVKGAESLTVATTRPETMLGDTAVAVHPKDRRYKKFIGKTLILPLVNRSIPIIADGFVDPKFGTGAVKVTPAHDPNDFEMGKRHGLPMINILAPNGRLNDQAQEFSGMDRFEGREAVLAALEQRKLLVKQEDHNHSVGHCYRCLTVVEPYLSRQWFVRMQPLAEPAIEVVKKQKIRFVPKRWTKVYLHWMENIRDWCISRQIWWGHRLPVWYCQDCPEGKNIVVSEETPTQCPQCGGQRLRQDEDVLDTWFSSWLWPFATFGWPGDAKQTDYFYPTSALFTASEIIFFWVARMIMAGLEFMQDIPFQDVYIHGTVRDSKGIKMSKSLGNAIDPLAIINEYGADALRFSLIINSGQDLYISKEKFEIGRNFANKIWNAARLVLLNCQPGEKDQDVSSEIKKMDLPSRWIVSRFYATLEGVNRALASYRFSEAESLVYEFFWHDYCDWYLEIIKGNFQDRSLQKVAFAVLEKSVRMIHPFMPFVTEEIWQHISPTSGALTVQAWPVVDKKGISKKAVSDMQLIKDIIVSIRNLKARWNIKPQQEIDCLFAAKGKKHMDLLRSHSDLFISLVRIKTFSVTSSLPSPKNAAMGSVEDVTFYLPLSGVIDLEKEKGRMTSQLERERQTLKELLKRLKNPHFINKAPADVVAREKERAQELKSKIGETEAAIKNFQ